MKVSMFKSKTLFQIQMAFWYDQLWQVINVVEILIKKKRNLDSERQWWYLYYPSVPCGWGFTFFPLAISLMLCPDFLGILQEDSVCIWRENGGVEWDWEG